MINFVISIDESTTFLFEIVKIIESKGIQTCVFEIHPNEDSYREQLEKVSLIEKKSTIIFLGHGQSDRLYGGELIDVFEKRAFVLLRQMNVFQDQNLFLLACDSAELIKSSFKQSKTIKSIGFGGLPTSKEEIENDRKFANEGITVETIEEFKNEMVKTIAHSLSIHYRDFNLLKDYLILLLDSRINNALLIKKNSHLAELLFKMRNELVLY